MHACMNAVSSDADDPTYNAEGEEEEPSERGEDEVEDLDNNIYQHEEPEGEQEDDDEGWVSTLHWDGE